MKPVGASCYFVVTLAWAIATESRGHDLEANCTVRKWTGDTTGTTHGVDCDLSRDLRVHETVYWSFPNCTTIGNCSENKCTKSKMVPHTIKLSNSKRLSIMYFTNETDFNYANAGVYIFSVYASCKRPCLSQIVIIHPNWDGVCANLNALNSSCLDDTQKKEDAQNKICGKIKGGPGYSSNGIILTCNNTQPINHSDCEELTVILSIIIGVLCIALLPSLWMCLVHVRKRVLTRRQARPTVSNSRCSSETTERPMNGNVIRSLEATVLPTRNQSQWSNIPTTSSGHPMNGSISRSYYRDSFDDDLPPYPQRVHESRSVGNLQYHLRELDSSSGSRPAPPRIPIRRQLGQQFAGITGSETNLRRDANSTPNVSHLVNYFSSVHDLRRLQCTS